LYFLLIFLFLDQFMFMTLSGIELIKGTVQLGKVF